MRKTIRAFHRPVVYGCGCEGIDSRDNAADILCPRCAGTAWRGTQRVLSYEERLAAIDRSSMPFGTCEDRRGFEDFMRRF